MLKRIFNKEWVMLLFGMCSARLQQLPYWDKPNTWSVMTTYWIKAPFISFTWNSSSIEFSSLMLTCSVSQFSLTLSLITLSFPPPLFFPFLISSKFLTGRKAAVIKSWDVPRGTYYVERANSTMFPALCLPVGLSAIDLGGRCQYKKRRQVIIIVIKLLLQHVYAEYRFDICCAVNLILWQCFHDF